MFGIKADFKSGGPITQIPVTWFNAVASFLNHIVAGPCLKIKLPDEPSIEDGVVFSVDTDQLDARYETAGAMGTPVDNTAASTATDATDPFGSSFTSWTSGGNNGVKLRAYILVSGQQYSHRLDPIDIDVASNGTIRSISVPAGNHSIWIGA